MSRPTEQQNEITEIQSHLGRAKNSIIKFDEFWLLLSREDESDNEVKFICLRKRWECFSSILDAWCLMLGCTLSSSEIRGFHSKLVHFMIIWRLFALNVLFRWELSFRATWGSWACYLISLEQKRSWVLLEIVLMSSRISQVSAVKRIFQPCRQLSSLNFTNGRIENWNSKRIRK